MDHGPLLWVGSPCPLPRHTKPGDHTDTEGSSWFLQQSVGQFCIPTPRSHTQKLPSLLCFERASDPLQLPPLGISWKPSSCRQPLSVCDSNRVPSTWLRGEEAPSWGGLTASHLKHCPLSKEAPFHTVIWDQEDGVGIGGNKANSFASEACWEVCVSYCWGALLLLLVWMHLATFVFSSAPYTHFGKQEKAHGLTHFVTFILGASSFLSPQLSRVALLLRSEGYILRRNTIQRGDGNL